MRRTPLYLFVLLCLIQSWKTMAQSAKTKEIGDTLSDPKIDLWLNQDSAPREIRKYTVIDFWATWCKPCIVSLKHLDSIADLKQPDFSFWAVDIAETPPKTPIEIEKKIRSIIKSRNVLFGIEDSLYKASKIMASIGETGIPQSIVYETRSGRIIWKGHPKHLPEVISKLSANSYNIDSARKIAGRLRFLEEKRDEFFRTCFDLTSNYKLKDSVMLKKVYQSLKPYLDTFPDLKYERIVAAHLFHYYLYFNHQEAFLFANQIIENSRVWDGDNLAAIYTTLKGTKATAINKGIYQLGIKSYILRQQFVYPELIDEFSYLLGLCELQVKSKEFQTANNTLKKLEMLMKTTIPVKGQLMRLDAIKEAMNKRAKLKSSLD